MKLAVTAAVFTALPFTALWLAAPLAAAEGDRWVIEGQNVNVRSGPSTTADILMTIDAGERIVEIAAKGGWYFVDFPDQDKRGWVFGELLVKPGATAAAAPAAPEPAAKLPAPAPTPVVETATPVVTPEPAPSAPEPQAVTVAELSEAEPNTDADQDVAALSTSEEPAAVKSFRETVVELNDRAVSVAGIELFDDVRSIGGGGVQVLATETWATVPEAGQSSYMNALFDRWQSMASGLGPLSLQIVDPNGAVMMERSGS